MIRYKNQDFATEIIDTAGQVLEDFFLPASRRDLHAPPKSCSTHTTFESKDSDEYSILNSKHFIGIHGYVIVYSVASKQSFEMARVIRDKILNHLSTCKDSNHVQHQAVDWVPIVIVGNKSDLRPEQRQVTPEDGKALAEEFKCAWTEASARYNENVLKAFELIISEVERSQNPSEPAGGSKCTVM
ncbi:hypothetical protein SNOG_09429 [Parastagonospora nodorum SN15]|uniref:Rheb small monomeric GTPase RhbA n=1 Tax=Phaeosphaeria nodorum (strain SN15 / ATCC MYA-4574 / FGSC 10173) TaxID=321614 RepID=Q0UFN5_PHANO|nr:hypothetical protein SNOG_09429 [Parastagonospora nodorum SN15]EAT83621.2 hypothetical protein SNOG_09429 [Parastagonospora nodorum SN15]